MSFDQLINKVTQAENALEAHERRLTADLRQFKASWRAGWTPGRIVLAGLVSGFLVGRARPLRAVAKGGNAMQLITMLSGLFASGSAQLAASQAGETADSVADVAQAVAPEAAAATFATRAAAQQPAPPATPPATRFPPRGTPMA